MTAASTIRSPRFGYKLPNCAGVICDPALARPEALETLAIAAEHLGFDSVWLHDHLATPGELRRLSRPDFYEPLTVIARLSALTTRIRFGVATIILPLRDPVLLAKQVAALDAFAPNRLILGVGTGRYEDEFQALGVDLFTQRGRVTDEYLQILRGLWTEDSFTFAGQFRTLRGARVYPKPSGAVPIWVGGNSTAAIRRVARAGDGWVPAALDPDELRAGIQTLHRALDRRGRSLQAVTVGLSLTVALPTGRSYRTAQAHTHRRWLVGDEEAVTDVLRTYVAAGVEEFLLSFPAPSMTGTLALMARFAETILPRFRQPGEEDGPHGSRYTT